MCAKEECNETWLIGGNRSIQVRDWQSDGGDNYCRDSELQANLFFFPVQKEG